MNQSDIDKFRNFLTRHGATVLAPTSEWELVRFKIPAGTGIIYTNSRGSITATGEAERAYKAFQENKPWRAVNRKRQALRNKKSRLAVRDGKRCFVHGNYLGFDDLTIEHWLSFSQGGSDNDNNLALVCEDANKAMGNMAVSQKINYVISERQKLKEEESAALSPINQMIMEETIKLNEREKVKSV